MGRSKNNDMQEAIDEALSDIDALEYSGTTVTGLRLRSNENEEEDIIADVGRLDVDVWFL